MQIDFLGGTTSGRSIAVDSQRTINWYPEITSQGAKSQMILLPTPGTIIDTVVTSGGAVRKEFVSATNRFFAIVGFSFVEVLGGGTFVVRGNIGTNSGLVSIAENAFVIMISDASGGYLFDPKTNTFEIINNEGYLPGNSVICNNGYFIQNIIGSQNFMFSDYQISLPQKSTDWDALNWYNASSSQDLVKVIGSINNEVVTFGSKYIEFWFNSGGTQSNPSDIYSKVNNAYVNIGIQSEQSLASTNNTLFWLGSNAEGSNSVWMMNSYVPQRISNHGVEYAISHMNDTTDAIGYCYSQEGHAFYVLTFVSGNRTFVYDLTTQMWHERGYYNRYTGMNDAHRGISSVFWNGSVYIGDYFNGTIYRLDLDTYVDGKTLDAFGHPTGNPIRRERIGSHIHADRKRLFFREFEVDLERGIGEQVTIATQAWNGSGSGFETLESPDVIDIDPHLALQWSNDGGETWSNEYWSSPGRAGEFKNRVHWHRLGYSRDRVFKVSTTDPCKWILIGARASIEKEGGA